MYTLTAEERTALESVAAAVGVAPESLYRLIQFESGWDPQAKNPNSSARGLIQFIDGTAQWLGYDSSEDLVSRYPDRVSQLNGPVAEYLSKYAPYSGEQSLFMAVFYPAARTWEPDEKFPSWVVDVNPGIETPADYMAAVYAAQPMTQQQIASAIGLPGALRAGALLLIIGAVVALYYYNA